MIKQLYDQHRELEALADELARMVAQPTPPLSSTLAQVRWKLASQVGRHMAAEDALVRVPLRDSSDPAIRERLDQYTTKLLTLRSAFAAHNVRWNLPAALADWPNYCKAAKGQIQSLHDIMAWEERDFYPVAQRLSTH